MMSEGTSSLTVSPSSSDLASQDSHGKMFVSEPYNQNKMNPCLPDTQGKNIRHRETCERKRCYLIVNSLMRARGPVRFQYLSFPELTSDLHSVEVPAGVGAPVVVSYPDFFNYLTDILQLGKRQHSVWR